MNLDIKEFSAYYKGILRKPYSSGLHLTYQFPNIPLSLFGSFDSSIPRISQSLSYQNSHSFFSLNLSSDKFYKANLFFTPQTQASICLYSRLKANFKDGEFTNNFEILYQDPTFKCSLGVMNRFIGIYMKSAMYGCNFALYGATLHDLSDYKARAMIWKRKEDYGMGLCKVLNGNLEGNFFYRISENKQVAGFIKTDQKKVQILLGLKAKVQDQIIRVRLDSEGSIGIEVKNLVNEWCSISAATDISVKEMAKVGKTFMGFGIRLELNKALKKPE